MSTKTKGSNTAADDAVEKVGNLHEAVPPSEVSKAISAAWDLPIPGAVTFESPSRFAGRVIWTPEGREFDIQQDLSIPLNNSYPALEAIAAYYCDQRVSGNGEIILVAPEDKLQREMGTGVMAYVSGNYKHDYVLDVAGTKRILQVFGASLPPVGGWAQVVLDAHGTLYIAKNEPIQYAWGQAGGWLDDPRYADNDAHHRDYLYWYLTTLEAILKGRCVSVGFPANGKATHQLAQRVMQAVQSENPLEANRQRRTAQKMGKRLQTAVDEVSQETDGEEAPVDPNADFLVPTSAGGTFDLATLTPNQGLKVQPKGSNFNTFVYLESAGVHSLIKLRDYMLDFDMVVVV